MCFVLINYLNSKDDFEYSRYHRYKKLTVPVLVNFMKQINMCAGNEKEFR